MQEKREKERRQREREKKEARRKKGYLWEVVSVEDRGTAWYNLSSGEGYRAQVFRIKCALEEYDSYKLSFFFEFKNKKGTLVPLKGVSYSSKSQRKRWPFMEYTIYIPEEKYGLDQSTVTAYAVEIHAERKGETCVVSSKCLS